MSRPVAAARRALEHTCQVTADGAALRRQHPAPHGAFGHMPQRTNFCGTRCSAGRDHVHERQPGGALPMQTRDPPASAGLRTWKLIDDIGTIGGAPALVAGAGGTLD